MYRMCGEGEGDGRCGGEGKRAGMDVGTMGDGGGDWDETGCGGVRGWRDMRERRMQERQ